METMMRKVSVAVGCALLLGLATQGLPKGDGWIWLAAVLVPLAAYWGGWAIGRVHRAQHEARYFSGATPAPEATPEADLTRYHDTPLAWPGPVLPPEDETDRYRREAREEVARTGRAREAWERHLARINPPSDAALSGLARHEAADWSGWHDYCKRATGGDDESGKPWRAE